MKAISKKLYAVKPADALRALSISLACIGLIAVTLYILINSPA